MDPNTSEVSGDPGPSTPDGISADVGSDAGSDSEYEESTFLVELSGLFDAAKIKAAVGNKQCCMIDAHTKTPVIQIGNSIFQGKWTTPMGSDMIFQDCTHTQTLPFIAVGDRRLVAEKAIVVPKDSQNEIKKPRIEDETKTKNNEKI